MLAQQLIVHNEIVDAALAAGSTPLPARFGTFFTDDAACIADLTRRASALRRILERVEGCVELTALVVPSTSRLLRELEPVGPRPELHEQHAGRRYMESLRAHSNQDAAIRTRAMLLIERLSSGVRSVVRQETRGRSVNGVYSVSHLVPRASQDAYREAVSAVAPGPDFRIVVSDPRAPYSFARDQEDSPGHDSGSLSSND
jgi:hypothetical protein